MKKLPAYLLAVCLVCACSAPVAPLETAPLERSAQLVDKSLNLYEIEPKLFRSEQLAAQDGALLKKLGVKTLINLRYFDRSGDKQAFEGQGFELVNTPLLTWHITPKEVAHVLWQIRQHQAKGAVLIHCYHGADRTGLISAMYRVVYQGWSLEAAKREMVQGGFGFHRLWKNVENFFSEANLQEVKTELAKLP